MTETILLALILVPCLVIAIVFHEVAHGWTALALGDPTAKALGRLSFNPIRHVDPVGTIVVPGAMLLLGGPVFGWAKPVPVIKERLNNPRFGMMAVGAAGPAMNFFLAAIGAVALGMFAAFASAEPSQMAEVAVRAMTTFILINIFLALFNLLPIPPFDGSHIVEGLLPPKAARLYEKARPAGMLLFFAIVALSWFAPDLGVIENLVGPPVGWAMDRYLDLARLVAGE
ncbi:site-2 protease family protein [Altererythrobacter confluentis]|uniref:Site-2 protease family protein n=1 Tax=Allopontixanthobacter confluentis TaxID=1849021 RepID=A0A6L7GFP8_9SPHN|nr:site-2 protease family protein [Allopontixanthobacter confluentis]MXP14697.1 site-2 protease family protein [Allopontixanthobacter confluentis]